MRLHLTLPLLIGLAACGDAREDSPPAKSLPELANRVADALGIDAWRELGRLSFTWKHVGKGLSRSYEWRPREGTVEVRVGTPKEGQTSVRIPAGPLPADAPDNERSAHRAWVNDSYWFLFPLLILEDGSTVTAIESADVPGFPDLGTLRALDVRYPETEGYTGGDRYVLYVGADDLPVAWAFHRGGAEKPTLVTTRTPRRLANGISLPTRFDTADKKTFIEILDVTAEPAR